MEPTRSLQQILLVDDDPNDRLLASRELRQEFPEIQIQEVSTWDQFETSLAHNGFDLVITDYDLRWSTGLDVLKAVKNYDPNFPVVMFTDSGSQEVAVEAMKAGLDDYVLKSPKHLIRLAQAVRSVWENSQMRRRASDLEFRLQFLLNELNVGVFRSNLDGQLLEASDGLLQLFGASDITEAQAFFQRHIGVGAVDRDDQQPQHREVQIADLPGGPRWFQISETLVDAETYALVDGLVSDITVRKQTSAELRSLNQTLEERVDQRTARLETLNRELEMFAFSVSHDLRSPIRQIDGFAALLEQGLQHQKPALKSDADQAETADDEADLNHYVSRIRMLTERAGQMIDDLLQFSRTGRAEMHYADVSMERLVQEVGRQTEPLFQNRKIRWEIGQLPPVWGDRDLLRKVWQNLIENAIKYTRQQPEAIITIGSEIRERDIVFFIQDNGIGFDMNDTARLFGVFQRMANARDFDGSGVGLANVQRVIHRHQGQLWAEGQLDVGATFYFSLPKKNA